MGHIFGNWGYTLVVKMAVRGKGRAAGAFAEWLSAELARRGWTNAELARRVGVSEAAVSKWLGGAKPDAHNLVALAEVFVVPVEELARIIALDRQEEAKRRARIAEPGAEWDIELSPEERSIVQLLRSLPPGLRRSTIELWLSLARTWLQPEVRQEILAWERGELGTRPPPAPAQQ